MLRFFCIAAPLYAIAAPACSSGQCDDEDSSLLQLKTLSDYGRRGMSEATGVDQSVDLEMREDAYNERLVDTGSFVELDDADSVETDANELQSDGSEAPRCSPCEIRYPEHGGAEELDIDIWNDGLTSTQTPRPVVFAFHGNGGNVKSVKSQCKAFNVAGFVCASVSPQSTKSQPSIFVEDAITYVRDNHAEYNIDQDNLFLYGYSGGGHTMLRFMMYTAKYELRSHVKGMISDASAPGDGEFNWQKEVDGKPLDFPPYLMLHCTEDGTMKPQWSVKRSVSNIDKANKKRDDDNKILYKWVKFTKESKCNHGSLLLNFGMGEDSAVTFIENILQAADSDLTFSLTHDDPFLHLPDTVDHNGERLRCVDVQPPKTWKHNTCEKQLMNTNMCAERQSGIRTDGYCHKTCGVGVCSAAESSSTPTIATVPAFPTTAATVPTTTAAPVGQQSSTSCADVQPPQRWNQNTCEKQLMNTDNCAKRRDGTKDDGYCHKTCGVCLACEDVQPPRTWKQNTCQKQLMNTDNCAKRRAGTGDDGYCHKTCGVCQVIEDN